MRKDLLLPGNSVLLLGEGNFSFSLSLLKYLEIPLKLTSTCFETVLSVRQKENCQMLKDLGASVHTGVDATKIHEHDKLKSQVFDKIIFNFPHSGGKMKIHLNRYLLRLFFVSASRVLKAPEGRVIVTLCSGQGADYMTKRCWGDSWQVVDMAGHANLALLECSPFDWSLFPHYDVVGYRSQEKGFHADGALVHVFHPIEPTYCGGVHPQDLRLGNWVCGSPQIMPVHARRINQNILNNKSSPVFFILDQLYNQAKLHLPCQLKNEEGAHYKTSILHIISHIFSQWNLEDNNIMIYSGYIFNELSSKFEEPPVNIQTLLLGKENFEIFDKFLGSLIVTFNKSHYIKTFSESPPDNYKNDVLNRIFIKDEKSDCVSLVAELVSINMNNKFYLATLIYTDVIASIFFSLATWRQLWAESGKVRMELSVPFVANICPFPHTYSFDLSFRVNDEFIEDKMLKILWNTAGEILVDVKKIDEYVSPDGGWKSRCYRLSYLSFDKPVYRKGILFFHQEVVGKVISSILNVSIR